MLQRKTNRLKKPKTKFKNKLLLLKDLKIIINDNKIGISLK